MKVLAIETSCDDTCVAIIKASEKKKGSFEILSNVVSSQTKIHQKWGGVYPTMAKREHQRNLVFVLKKALKEANDLKVQSSKLKAQSSNLKFKTLRRILIREEELCKKLEEFLKKYQKPKIDAIAITIGPGLEPCLWVGVNFAKALACCWNLPAIPVNHIEGHIVANFLPKIGSNSQFLILNFQKLFPALCLIVSGGHTQLILMRGIGKYKIIGETRDDAAGECFDKTARILGLGYPGGPAIAKEAAKLPNSKFRIPSSEFRAPIKLPRPMINQKNYDFSFSGLKTAVLYNYKNQPAKIRKSKEYVQAMAREIQQAVIDILIKKTIKAARAYKARSIILGGGVAANKELRRQFQQKIKKDIPSSEFRVPSFRFCVDNAAMIGLTGRLNGKKAKNWRTIKADANLRI
jgi:N6-L-threonylcarbamoyladenine synthase